MRDRLTAVIAIVLLALLAAATYWYSQTSRLNALPNTVSRDGPDAVVDGATMTQFDAQGRATNKLIAERILHFPADDRVEAVRPRLITVREDQPQVEVRAERARIDDSGARALLTGDVTLVRSPGKAGEPPMRLVTEKMTVLPDSEQFTTDAPVLLERGGSTIRAVGMDYDNIKRTVKFHSRVQGTIEPGVSAGGRP
jgi:lipopolysaccharide export system protein LptC